MLDARLPPLVILAGVEAAIVYLVLTARCSEDECLDRPVVAAIASAFALVAAASIMNLRGPGRTETALRWLLAVGWPLIAWVMLWLLPFDVVFD